VAPEPTLVSFSPAPNAGASPLSRKYYDFDTQPWKQYLHLAGPAAPFSPAAAAAGRHSAGSSSSDGGDDGDNGDARLRLAAFAFRRAQLPHALVSAARAVKDLRALLGFEWARACQRVYHDAAAGRLWSQEPRGPAWLAPGDPRALCAACPTRPHTSSSSAKTSTSTGRGAGAGARHRACPWCLPRRKSGSPDARLRLCRLCRALRFNGEVHCDSPSAAAGSPSVQAAQLGVLQALGARMLVARRPLRAAAAEGRATLTHSPLAAPALLLPSFVPLLQYLQAAVYAPALLPELRPAPDAGLGDSRRDGGLRSLLAELLAAAGPEAGPEAGAGVAGGSGEEPVSAGARAHVLAVQGGGGGGMGLQLLCGRRVLLSAGGGGGGGLTLAADSLDAGGGAGGGLQVFAVGGNLTLSVGGGGGGGVAYQRQSWTASEGAALDPHTLVPADPVALMHALRRRAQRCMEPGGGGLRVRGGGGVGGGAHVVVAASLSRVSGKGEGTSGGAVAETFQVGCSGAFRWHVELPTDCARSKVFGAV
jgi:hypothetical protein